MSEPSHAAAEVVVFVHSTGTGPMLWAGVGPEARAGLPALVPANLGYPPNPPVPRGTVVTAEDDLREVLGSVPPGARKVHLVGHSYGGQLALRAAEVLGDRTASLFLWEPVLFGALRKDPFDEGAVAEARHFTEHPWFLTDDDRGGTDPWLEVFVDYWNRPGSWKRMPEAMRAHSLATGWKMYQEVRACFADDRAFEGWRLDVPTTVCAGTRSPAASRAMAVGLSRGRANVTHVVVPDVGHMAPLTNAAPVHAELRAHFARVR